MDWFKSIAPLLGTALVGPLGGAAATFIAEKLGMEAKTIEAVSEVLNSGKMSPEQIAQVRLAEIEFEKFLKQNGIDLEKVHAGDRANARDMHATIRSRMPAILSILVTVGFFGTLFGLMFGVLKVADSQALLIMLGSLGTAWGAVMAFWFGTTNSSGQKNELLANAVARR